MSLKFFARTTVPEMSIFSKNVCTYRDVRYKNCSIGDPKTNTEVPKRVKKINLQIFKENGFKNYNTTVTCAVIMVHIV